MAKVKMKVEEITVHSSAHLLMSSAEAEERQDAKYQLTDSAFLTLTCLQETCTEFRSAMTVPLTHGKNAVLLLKEPLFIERFLQI